MIPQSGSVHTRLASCGFVVAAAAFSAGGVAPPIAFAQQPARSLHGPATTLDDQFVGVARVRELSDGRVLVLDVNDTRLVVADFKSGTATDIGRKGDGPGEYRRLSGMYTLGGDSTLVDDQPGRRWLVLDGARVVATVASSPDGKWVALCGADAFGKVLEIRPYAFRRSPGVPYTPMRSSADSLAVIVRHRAIAQRGSGPGNRFYLTSREDVIARIRGMAAGQTIAWRPIVSGGPPIRWLLENPLAAEQQALLFPDGWIALALTDPYRVLWTTPDGRRLPPIALTESGVSVDDQLKQALVVWRWPNVEPPFGDNELPPWPRKMPPFLNDALLAMPDGRLAIRRTFDPNERAVVYDVVSRERRPVERISMSANERIVGFGSRAVYVVSKDADDVETIRRYAWP